MTNAPRLHSQFKISDKNLDRNEPTKDAYEAYTGKRRAFCEARRELNDSIKLLHDLLDAPLRAAGHVPEGKDWSLKDDDYDGLIIYVWSEPRQKGRRKAEVPTQQISFSSKEGKAA